MPPLKGSQRREPIQLLHGKGTVPLSEFGALRTVPVYVTKGKRRLMVNVLLDDASSWTYLNSDIAAKLGL